MTDADIRTARHLGEIDSQLRSLAPAVAHAVERAADLTTRVALVEHKVIKIEERLDAIAAHLDRVEAKLAGVLAQVQRFTNMARGAWWLLGIVVAVLAAIFAAAGFFLDKMWR
jgi:hypothetical protein